MLTIVPHEHIDFAIKKVRHLLKRFVDAEVNKNFLTIQDLITDLKAGYYNLWLVFEEQDVTTFVTTHIWQNNRTKVCEIRTCCGDLGQNYQQLFQYLPVIEEWAREMGCQYTTIRGRKGWGKLLREYDQPEVIYTKEL